MVLGREAVDIWLLWSHGYRITTIEGSVNLMLLVCIPCLRCILWIWNIVLSSLHAFLCLWCIKHEFSWEKFTLVDILFELQIHYTQSTHYTSAVTSRCADDIFRVGLGRDVPVRSIVLCSVRRITHNVPQPSSHNDNVVVKTADVPLPIWHLNTGFWVAARDGISHGFIELRYPNLFFFHEMSAQEWIWVEHDGWM